MRISDWSSDVCSSDLSEELRCRHLRLPGTAWTRSSTATSGKLWRNCLPVSRCRVPSAASSSGRRLCDGLNVEGWVSFTSVRAEIGQWQCLRQRRYRASCSCSWTAIYEMLCLQKTVTRAWTLYSWTEVSVLI